MKKIKQILAIVMCVFLAGMYIVSFVSAILAKPQAHGLFMGSVGLTLMLPLLLYAYMVIYKVIHPETNEMVSYDFDDEEDEDAVKEDDYF